MCHSIAVTSQLECSNSHELLASMSQYPYGWHAFGPSSQQSVSQPSTFATTQLPSQLQVGSGAWHLPQGQWPPAMHPQLAHPTGYGSFSQTGFAAGMQPFPPSFAPAPTQPMSNAMMANLQAHQYAMWQQHAQQVQHAQYAQMAGAGLVVRPMTWPVNGVHSTQGMRTMPPQLSASWGSIAAPTPQTYRQRPATHAIPAPAPAKICEPKGDVLTDLGTSPPTSGTATSV